MTGACLEAGLSFGCAAAFLFTLVFLHRLRPELDPSWRMISEYAIGHYGLDNAIGTDLSFGELSRFIFCTPPKRRDAGRFVTSCCLNRHCGFSHSSYRSHNYAVATDWPHWWFAYRLRGALCDGFSDCDYCRCLECNEGPFAGTCVVALDIASGVDRAGGVRCFALLLRGNEIRFWTSRTRRLAESIHDGHLQCMAHGRGIRVMRWERWNVREHEARRRPLRFPRG